ncbi:1-phosphatidylinositol-3-phosphate 5-kinase FAB1B-like isoform X2 [Amaranthus tricolor]|uniref:1-phosphatidylinositol-3-phosphate 5-kinase FAB1B-like isoform X2 n=1 Tax=Amaranthus tricolor TaxID=29722 RepID=UPI00258DDA46|nr:1-phosphatidylinositol-3-phosphate 5-kinase FAB1B-like isoform X2 [Amaranthus tricolor]
MGNSINKGFDLFRVLKTWIPCRFRSAKVSRDFWMPDHSCRVCYDCDAQFTVFNRRHHCRLCGRIFCGKCTENSVPAHSFQSSDFLGEWEKVRVCNYCFKQWEQGSASIDHGSHDPIDSVSADSDASSKSSESAFPYQSAMIDPSVDVQFTKRSGRSNITVPYADDASLYQCGSCTNRSDNDDDDDNDVFGVYNFDSPAMSTQFNGFYGPLEFNAMQNAFESYNYASDMDTDAIERLCSSAFQECFNVQDDGKHLVVKKADDFGDVCEASSSLCTIEEVNNITELVDFENNGLLWLPPEPENEEDDGNGSFFDDDDDDLEISGEWGHLWSYCSFGSGEYHEKEKSGEYQKKALKNVVDEHFRALVSQLLQAENIPVTDDNAQESWLEIITALSWEVATLLKPDTSMSGGMDPGGYVKVKCVASGRRSESMVVKGVVFKKSLAHRRMASRIQKSRLMILGGALEYQRVANHLSSFDTLLQQEMDHLKMAVAKIDAHRPNVLLLEKSVSRYAQEYILAKDISLVLNVKRPILERIARCTGAQIVPSIDHLSEEKIGYCDLFHVDKCYEDHGSANQDGKKLTKTLMYFEGCPKPLGFTILLRGANGDELKKVKHVVQYGVFAAYHLALETSFLADEGASLPEHLFDESLTVALSNKSLNIDCSISLVPGFTFPAHEKQGNFGEPEAVNTMSTSLHNVATVQNTELIKSLSLPSNTILKDAGPVLICSNITSPSNDFCEQLHAPLEDGHSESQESMDVTSDYTCIAENISGSNKTGSEAICLQQDAKSVLQNQPGSLKEAFPKSISDAQSILVSLSSRCVWKGTVCERSHVLRIKYYGSFDKPLGRFLQDQLFDQSYRCRSCDMPSDAHVHCYTHQQGTLTISVKNLPDMLLPGEREKKVWMWHRCLRCPRTSGFPPATRRVVMSDAAWGLSFGKFLELSFSNHAAASRVASCGHSLHRDCLQFYGCGKMVACFWYAPIVVYSVYLPPAIVDFNYEAQDWIQKEAEEVVIRFESLFSEVDDAIKRIAKKKYGDLGAGAIPSESRLAALEELLEYEKTEIEDLRQKFFDREVIKGHPTQDILEINRLMKQLLILSSFWDECLVDAAKDDNLDAPNGFMGASILTRSNNVFTGGEALPLDQKLTRGFDLEEEIKSAGKPIETALQTRTSLNLTCDFEDQSEPSTRNENYERLDPLACGSTVRRAVSDSQFINISDTLDVSYLGKTRPGIGVRKDNSYTLMGSISVDSSLATVVERLALKNQAIEMGFVKASSSSSPVASTSSKGSDNAEDTLNRLKIPFLNRALNISYHGSHQNFDRFCEYKPTYVLSARDLGSQDAVKWLLPEGPSETVVPIYDDEPTSIISYALNSHEYHTRLSDDGERSKVIESASSLPLHESASFHQFLSLAILFSELNRTHSIDESISSPSPTRSSFMSDPLLYTKPLHITVPFTVNGPIDKVKYTVTCYYAQHFEALRKVCCPSQLDFIRSLSRCKKWGAQGGKSNVFFAKTLDDRFIIKQVTKTELESFIKFAPKYFEYLMEAIKSRSPTCLAKILGIYQVTSKNLKGGKESKMDILVMENLFFRRSVATVYDLKGSSRSRYNSNSNGNNKVLLDQNLIETMPTSPIFVSKKAKRSLERAVWNDTSFLASVDVMDYSLLLGVDEEKHELVVGIIDFMRQYTWDKHLETWVKTSGILGGPKNVSPTVISPDQYKKRFRKAMTTYFLMVPDNWSLPCALSAPTAIPCDSPSKLCEENAQEGCETIENL